MSTSYRKKTILFFLLGLCAFYCYGQPTDTSYMTGEYRFNLSVIRGVNYNYCYLQDVNKSLFTKRFTGLSLKFGKHAHGSHFWHHRLNYPYYGVGLAYYKISKNNIIGHPVSLFSYIDVPLMKSTNIFRLQLEGGLAYFLNNKKLFYSLEKNPIVGSPYNFHIGMALRLAFPIGKKMAVASAFKLQHYSNGSIRTPNWGVNLIGISTTVTYKGHNRSFQRVGDKKAVGSVPVNTYSLSARFAFTTHRENEEPNGYFGIISPDYWRKYSYLSYLNIGVDNFYEISSDTKKEIERYYFGIHIGHKLKINRVSLIGQLGALIKRRFGNSDWFYTKVTIEYELISNLHLSISIKSKESMAADFVEWGMVRYFEFGH